MARYFFLSDYILTGLSAHCPRGGARRKKTWLCNFDILEKAYDLNKKHTSFLYFVFIDIATELFFKGKVLVCDGTV